MAEWGCAIGKAVSLHILFINNEEFISFCHRSSVTGIPPKKKKPISDTNPRGTVRPQKNGNSDRATQYEALRRTRKRAVSVECRLEEARDVGFQEGYHAATADFDEVQVSSGESRKDDQTDRLRQRYEDEWKEYLERDIQQLAG